MFCKYTLFFPFQVAVYVETLSLKVSYGRWLKRRKEGIKEEYGLPLERSMGFKN